MMLRRPSDEQLDALRRRAADDELTYSGLSADAAAPTPIGFRRFRGDVGLGSGDAVWAGAVAALQRWAAHTSAGVTVWPHAAPFVVGDDVVIRARVGLLWFVAPCRIVATTDVPDRFGFVYGTLPGHPENGEEAFHVARAPDGRIRLEIEAVSRPATDLARLGGPVGRAIRDRITGRYLDGFRDAVARREAGDADAGLGGGVR